jgi:alpha-amylase/alpha-mannosidase (GH57 family)
MKPISIAILWHQHQPYYKKESEFILPWVRLHGVKDYADLALLVQEYPNIKHTFNLVPSLMVQIEEYINHSTTDKIERLTLVEAQNLTLSEKHEIIRLFFLCNHQTMIAPYPRYKQLYDLSQDDNYNAIQNFSTQDWIDLQCWYNLTWIGQISRRDPKISALFSNCTNFTESDKTTILNKHREILSSILPILKQLQQSHQCEISVTPMYHPILPLVIDTNSHMESSPASDHPEKRFSFPEDADWHLNKAHSFYNTLFDQSPNGCWPSEGSVSTEALYAIKKNGFSWTATDEQVLYNTVKSSAAPIQHCFPHSFSTPNGNISIFFRDHTLSDTIGFLYSTWNAHDAANDFVQRILDKRNEIIHHYGEDALDEAVLSIILDGENCWEYYPDNGIHFLRSLLSSLSHPLIKTCTFQEVAKPNHRFHVDSIVAGSWINGTFSIWIGNEDENKAWSVLSEARQALETSTVALEKIQEAKESLYIAEGSDAFWWYGNDHQAENRDDFDDLFRYYIAKCYHSLELSPPSSLNQSLRKNSSFQRQQFQTGYVDLLQSQKYPKETNWDQAGFIMPTMSSGAIHSNIEILECIRYAFDTVNGLFGCRLEMKRNLSNEESILIEFMDVSELRILFTNNSVTFHCLENSLPIHHLYSHILPYIEFGINSSVFTKLFEDVASIKVAITVSTKDTTIRYPQYNSYELINPSVEKQY